LIVLLVAPEEAEAILKQNEKDSKTPTLPETDLAVFAPQGATPLR